MTSTCVTVQLHKDKDEGRPSRAKLSATVTIQLHMDNTKNDEGDRDEDTSSDESEFYKWFASSTSRLDDETTPPPRCDRDQHATPPSARVRACGSAPQIEQRSKNGSRKNINRASEEDLLSCPMIGGVVMKRIRQAILSTHGKVSVTELKNIPQLGPERLKMLKERFEVPERS